MFDGTTVYSVIHMSVLVNELMGSSKRNKNEGDVFAF